METKKVFRFQRRRSLNSDHHRLGPKISYHSASTYPKMDDHGRGHIHSGPTDLQHNGTVSLAEISNDARLEAHNKLTSRQNTLDTTCQQKDLANERTPKASAASLPAASMPVVPNHTPEGPVIQNMPVISNSSISTGYTNPMNSAVAVRSGGNAATSNATPFVTVEPSSPVGNQVDSRLVGASNSLTTISEGGHAPASQSNLDRRASRRRSAMEVRASQAPLDELTLTKYLSYSPQTTDFRDFSRICYT